MGIQRSRILVATIEVVDELGYAGASVARITARAGVSRRTFYEIFDNREQCVIAVLDSAEAQLLTLLGDAGLTGGSWRERVRGGLWRILCFLDREPSLARVCIAHTQGGEHGVLRRRQVILDRLVAVIGEGRGERAGGSGVPSELTAQGVLGAALAVVHARLLEGEKAHLQDLLGELMSVIVLPYLGASAARRERERPVPTVASGGEHGVGPSHASPVGQLPMRMTYRTARVIEEVAANPGLSNREIALRVGIHDQGQISRLLSRLQRLGLLANLSGATQPGSEPNRWLLSDSGAQLARTISAHVSATHYRQGATP